MGILELKKQVLTVENGLIKVNFLEESDFDLSKENYYKSKLMSNTELSKIQYNDFFRYLYLKNNPTTSSAMSFGSLVHCLILEPESFTNDFLVLPNERGFGSSDTKTAQTWASENRLNEAQTVVTSVEYETAQAIKSNFLNSTSAFLDLGSKGVNTEVSLDGEVNGLYFKGKIDIIDFDNRILYDIKTIRDYPTADCIRKVSYNNHYFRQAALYQELFRQQHCDGRWDFKFLFIHNSDDYSVTVGSMPQIDGIERGFEELLNITDKYNVWLRSLDGVEVEEYRRTYCNEVEIYFPKYGNVTT